MPDRFNDPSNCLKFIRLLDEAHQFVQPKIFEQFDALMFRVSLEYFACHARSIFKPVVELWNGEFKSEIVKADLNSALNPDLFQTDAVNCIFNRFPLPFVFNKLPNRFYYMGQLEIQRLNVSIQG